MNASFQHETERIGRLVIEPAAPDDARFTTTSAGRVHRVGFEKAPLFELEFFADPDRAWRIEALREGRTAHPQRVPDLPDALRRFAAPTSGAGAVDVLVQLPPGEYRLVRSPLAPRTTGSVLLGNALLAPPPHVRVLLDERNRNASVVGLEPDRPPDLAQPLFGLSVLNYTDDPSPHGVLFFPCLDTSGFQPGGEGRDLLLVLPLEGPWVLDRHGAFAGYEGEARTRLRWASEWGPRFAERLAGEVRPAPRAPLPRVD